MSSWLISGKKRSDVLQQLICRCSKPSSRFIFGCSPRAAPKSRCCCSSSGIAMAARLKQSLLPPLTRIWPASGRKSRSPRRRSSQRCLTTLKLELYLCHTTSTSCLNGRLRLESCVPRSLIRAAPSMSLRTGIRRLFPLTVLRITLSSFGTPSNPRVIWTCLLSGKCCLSSAAAPRSLTASKLSKRATTTSLLPPVHSLAAMWRLQTSVDLALPPRPRKL
mmetsp:Transcript_14946/g.35263  ORF Transcript_14946/g.35263 Transcript_14946/m.35263 type:complete len:220 (+) Transcript_14946:406-1065(+)